MAVDSRQLSRGEGTRVGNLDFGQPASAWYRENIEFPFSCSTQERKVAPF